MPSWKRNLVVLCLAQLLTMVGFTSYFPSIPFLIQEMGVTSTSETASWLAAFWSGGSIAMMIASPIWGSLSDRWGRKVMLVRATAAGAILAFVMSLVQTPQQLIVVRVLQGVFCGTVSASITLVATQTPDEHLGFSLGAMQTAQFVGQALGPLVGGVIADALGIRRVFVVSAIMMAVSVTLTITLVREKRQEADPDAAGDQAPQDGFWAGMRTALSRDILMLLLGMACVSLAYAVVSPIMSLYVQSLAPDSERLSTLAGAAVSVSAVTSAVASLAVGRLGDRHGQKAVLVVCGFCAMAIHIPQAWVNAIWQLLVLRAFQGVFLGGMTPTANALLAKITPEERRGTVFGISSSFSAGGRAVGPAIGAGVAAAFGMPPVFLVTAGIFCMVALLTTFFVREPKEALSQVPALDLPCP